MKVMMKVRSNVERYCIQ